jgi:translation initiation factor 5
MKVIKLLLVSLFYLFEYNFIVLNRITFRWLDASITRFNSWYAVNWNKNQDAILEELRMVQTFASLHVRYRPLILLGALCTDALITGKELSKYKDLISAVSGNTAGTQRHLIAAVEWFCGSRYPQLLKLFPVVLKQLFDLELVEEDVFLAWSNDIARNEYSADSSLISLETLEELRNVAGPFMVWLQEAEEEDDDGEENDED